MKNYPLYTNRKVTLLDGLWDFAYLGKNIITTEVDPCNIKFDDIMDVPMAFDATPKYSGKKGLFAYRTKLKITPGNRALLKIGGMGMWNAFYLDGELIKVNRLPYSGMNIALPISDNNERELVVLSDNRINKETTPLFSSRYDFYSYGGFFRSIELHEVPRTWIDRAYITTVDLKSGLIKVKLSLKGDAPDNPIVSKDLKVFLSSEDIEERDQSVFDLKHDGMSVHFNLKIDNPIEWNPETPHLYCLRINTIFDSVVERFGLRILENRAKDILLNGKKLKLKGYCRHESHPQYGPALPYGQLVQDLQILKDLGCNFVRGAHYPQDQRFLDLCDKLGFLVFEETLGWQNTPDDFANQDFCSDSEEQTRLMVRNSFNHPSVIMWGFLNEGESHIEECRNMYSRVSEILREEDSSRFVTYATNHLLEDKFLELCDIISVNMYPGWYSRDIDAVSPLEEIDEWVDEYQKHLAETGQGEKPLIISEIGAGAIYGWRDPVQGHWSENYQADLLETVCNRVMDDQSIAGVALWQFCDGRSYQTSRAVKRPRSFNNKGTLDEYRRPKMAYEVVKKVFNRDK